MKEEIIIQSIHIFASISKEESAFSYVGQDR
jgi:hypothetical protein